MLSSLCAPLWTGAKRVNMRVSQQLHLQKKTRECSAAVAERGFL